ncbi:hypothetical protein FGG08_003279 [Glutinoglossum americanum]|uniref:Protein kinase domain-containing protein n=1 Tax=Glutinoglossum americanum TaxID=1670608 RepID=A0A9P8L3R0_9PEZI|nr:hypothetical protein FGG08_003279 [Glutinoglossum americanum]
MGPRMKARQRASGGEELVLDGGNITKLVVNVTTTADAKLDPLDKKNWEAYDLGIYHGAPVGLAADLHCRCSILPALNPEGQRSTCSTADTGPSQGPSDGSHDAPALVPHTNLDPTSLLGLHNSYHRHPPQTPPGSDQIFTQFDSGMSPVAPSDPRWAREGNKRERSSSDLEPLPPKPRRGKPSRLNTNLGNTSSKAGQGSSKRVQKKGRKTSKLPASVISFLQCGLRTINGGCFPDQDQLDGYSKVIRANLQDVKDCFKELLSSTEVETDSAYSTMPDLLSRAKLKALASWRECPEKGKKAEGGRFPCTWCPASFLKKSDWKRHEGYKYPQEGWACPFCYDKECREVRIMRSWDKLSKHITKVHQNSQMPGANEYRFPIKHKSKFPCGRCEKEFQVWGKRISHICDTHLERNTQDREKNASPGDGSDDGSDGGSDDGSDGDLDWAPGYVDINSGGGQRGNRGGRNGRGGGSQGRRECGSVCNQQQYQSHSCRPTLVPGSDPKPTILASLRSHSHAPNSHPTTGGVRLPLKGLPVEEQLGPRSEIRPGCQPPSLPGSNSVRPLKGNPEGKGSSLSLETGLVRLHSRQNLTVELSDPLPFTSIKGLGYGASGSVGQIYRKDARRVFAWKTIRPLSRSMRRHFLREVEVMKQLRHAHLVGLVGTYTQGVEFAIIMNPAADCDLGFYMEKFSPENHGGERQLCRWYSCLVSGLKYMHDHGIRHKDIKPRNILVNGKNILFCDFGISKLIHHNGLTTPGCGPMTEVYTPPEVAQEERRGRSADIWSLGCVFLEMTTVLAGKSVEEFHEFRSAASKRDPADASYHANLPAVMDWIAVLRHGKPQFPVSRALNSCVSMLDKHRCRRPDVHHLTDVFPPKPCCSARVENFDWGRPITLSRSQMYSCQDPGTDPVGLKSGAGRGLPRPDSSASMVGGAAKTIPNASQSSSSGSMTDGESEPDTESSKSGSTGIASLSQRWSTGHISYGIHRFLNEKESADWRQYREQPCAFSGPLDSLMESIFDRLLRRRGWWEEADRMGNEPGIDMVQASRRLCELTLD